MPTDTAQDATPKTENTAASTAKSKSPAARSESKLMPKPPTKAAGKPAAKRTAKASTIAAAKPSSKPVPAKAATKKAHADKKAKPKKAKLVRDSFTMPEAEHGLIAIVKKRCVALGLAVKKSEVLRAAIISFAAYSDASIIGAIQNLETIKTGRPPKG